MLYVLAYMSSIYMLAEYNSFTLERIYVLTEYASSKLYDKYELFEKAEEEHLCNKLKLIVTCKV